MNRVKRYILAIVAILALATAAVAQNDSSTATLRRGGSKDRAKTQNAPQVTKRMENRMETAEPSEADMAWMRVLYRELDLRKEANAPLYFPEEPVEGQESMFRLLMRLLADGQLTAYEYLDGREVFTDQYKVKVKDMLDRFHIYYKDAKGSSEKNPKFEIHESDVPATEVLSYYVIERWEFDKRTNKLKSKIEAICPVLHRSDDWGTEAVRYPMFWVKYSDLRPYLTGQTIFTSDSNNLATHTYDDFFQQGLYDGDIYKTRNLRNKSMMQLYPDPEERKHAQDSIQRQLDNFGKGMWVPGLDELAAIKAKKEGVKESNDSVAADNSANEKAPVAERKITTKRGSKSSGTKPAKVKKPKSAAKSSSSATRSVRNKRRR